MCENAHGMPGTHSESVPTSTLNSRCSHRNVDRGSLFSWLQAAQFLKMVESIPTERTCAGTGNLLLVEDHARRRDRCARASRSVVGLACRYRCRSSASTKLVTREIRPARMVEHSPNDHSVASGETCFGEASRAGKTIARTYSVPLAAHSARRATLPAPH